MYINVYKCKKCSNYNFYIYLFTFIYIFLHLYIFSVSIGEPTKVNKSLCYESFLVVYNRKKLLITLLYILINNYSISFISACGYI